MGNKDWNNYLKDILGDFKSTGDTPPLDDIAQPFDPESTLSQGQEQFHEDSLKEALSNYTPSGQVEGWERLEASLDAADQEFDEHVRNRINHYQAPADPHSWTLFLKSFSAHRLLRAKLIGIKIVESAAIVLLLITVMHMSQVGKLPFLTPTAEDIPSIQYPPQTMADALDVNANAIDLNVEESSSTIPVDPLPDKLQQPKKSTGILKATNLSTKGGEQISKSSILTALSTAGTSISFPVISEDAFSDPSPEPFSVNPFQSGETVPKIGLIGLANKTTSIANDEANWNSLHENIITPSLASVVNTIKTSKADPIPDPVFVSVAEKTYLEFGMMAQADYNQLKMPEDKLTNEGKQIVFPLLGITSPGYGAGFTLAIGHIKWALETGLVYSAKSFKPGRELTIGNAADNSNVEYEAMRMQLISVPLQYRYRFDHKGRLKAYALAGFGFHYIAQSDIDVMIEHNFSSLTEGEDPSNNPSLARTMSQAQRISEDIRDEAPFSTKSFISANLGLGLEYSVAERKTLFLQTAYQYQVPNLRFSNHNGKHVLSLSVQAGVRTPLGT